MSKTIIESLIPFITNMMNGQKEVKPGPQPEPENFKINGVALRVIIGNSETAVAPMTVNWNLLYEGEYPEISNVKLSLAGHGHGVSVSGHWDFVAEDDAEILNIAGGDFDYSHSTMTGTAQITTDIPEQEPFVAEGVQAAGIIAQAIKNINTQWAEPEDDSTAEAKVTVNGKVHTVPVLLEFTGEIEDIRVESEDKENVYLHCSGATFNEDIYHGLDAWHPFVEIRSLDNSTSLATIPVHFTSESGEEVWTYLDSDVYYDESAEGVAMGEYNVGDAIAIIHIGNYAKTFGGFPIPFIPGE